MADIVQFDTCTQTTAAVASVSKATSCSDDEDNVDRRLSLPAALPLQLRRQKIAATESDWRRKLSNQVEIGDSESSRSVDIQSDTRDNEIEADSIEVDVVIDDSLSKIYGSESAAADRSAEPSVESTPSSSLTPPPLPPHQPLARMPLTRPRQLPPRWHRHRHRHRFSVHSNDPAAGGCDDSDLCLLCHRCVAAPSGCAGGVEVAAAASSNPSVGNEKEEDDDDEEDEEQEDDSPRAIRWRKLPCDCRDRYLHLSCLETSFDEDAAYKGGHRQLTISCRSCQVQLRVRRQRGRRTCNRSAWLAFARHLSCAGLVAGLLLAFGAWSMLVEHAEVAGGAPTRRVTVVNASLVAAGCLTLLGFACLELRLLNGRFEFAFARVAAGSSSSAAASAATAAAAVNGGFDGMEHEAGV